MKTGKISENVLKRSVLKNINTKRKEVIKGAGIGSDCAFFQCENFVSHEERTHKYFAASSETVTLPVRDAGTMAVFSAVNNLAAGGSECFAIMICLVLPERSEEVLLQELMRQIENACAELAIQIAGGHTEVSSGVINPVITVTALGKPITDEAGALIQTHASEKGASITDLDIVMTKWIGLEGTMILAREKEKELLTSFPLNPDLCCNYFDLQYRQRMHPRSPLYRRSSSSSRHCPQRCPLCRRHSFSTMWLLRHRNRSLPHLQGSHSCQQRNRHNRQYRPQCPCSSLPYP